MALSPDAFRLDLAIAEVWNDQSVLSDDEKVLISACLDEDVFEGVGPPRGEHELARLQRVLAACEFLNGINVGGAGHWLTAHGQRFPDAIRTFIHQVAAQFHGVSELPHDFTQPLCQFLTDTKSHVATLNYDDLLYRPFVSSGVCDGYRGPLVDGMITNGYDDENLVRKWGNNFGWYLHLHGSPLFFTDVQGRVRKLSLLDLEQVNVSQSHIVLTHVKSKPVVIQASRLLRSYWDHFSKALDESAEVILFGYSGLDDHVNGLLAKRSARLPLRVIEWSGAGEIEARERFWYSVLNTEDLTLFHYDNILEFTDWAGEVR